MQPGDTVSLRVATPGGPTDLVGVVLALASDTLTLRRRDGAVITVPVADVRAGRVVPPGPAARTPVADLARIAERGWRALEVEPLGEWLLRAAGGFTNRANSVLPVGDPGMPLPAALDRVERWYAGRQLPPKAQVVTGATAPELTALLDERGWVPTWPSQVMVAELGPVLRPAKADPLSEVRLDEQPDDAWFAAYRHEMPGRVDGGLPPAARTLLTNHDTVTFASIRDGDRCVAIARAAVDGRWVGLFGVEVARDLRRRGLGRRVSLAALRWAVARGARRAYLQVAAENATAIALYAGLGFARHHDYMHCLGNVDG